MAEETQVPGPFASVAGTAASTDQTTVASTEGAANTETSTESTTAESTQASTESTSTEQASTEAKTEGSTATKAEGETSTESVFELKVEGSTQATDFGKIGDSLGFKAETKEDIDSHYKELYSTQFANEDLRIANDIALKGGPGKDYYTIAHADIDSFSDEKLLFDKFRPAYESDKDALDYIDDMSDHDRKVQAYDERQKWNGEKQAALRSIEASSQKLEDERKVVTETRNTAVRETLSAMEKIHSTYPVTVEMKEKAYKDMTTMVAVKEIPLHVYNAMYDEKGIYSAQKAAGFYMSHTYDKQIAQKFHEKGVSQGTKESFQKNTNQTITDQPLVGGEPLEPIGPFEHMVKQQGEVKN